MPGRQPTKHTKYYPDLAEKTWRHLNLFDEHTWGSCNSMDPDNLFAKTQFNIKDQSACAAHETAEYLLVARMVAPQRRISSP